MEDENEIIVIGDRVKALFDRVIILGKVVDIKESDFLGPIYSVGKKDGRRIGWYERSKIELLSRKQTFGYE